MIFCFFVQEYGIKVEEKLHISQSICTPLMRKIHSDLLQVCQQNAEEESTRLNSKLVDARYIYYMGLILRELSSGVCEQHRRSSACASAQSDQCLWYSHCGKYHM